MYLYVYLFKCQTKASATALFFKIPGYPFPFYKDQLKFEQLSQIY